jgi:hypothetical protein
MENKEQTINQDHLELVSSNQDDHENDRSVGTKRKSKSDDDKECKAMKTSTCDQEESVNSKPNLNIASNQNLEQEERQVNSSSFILRVFYFTV